MSLNKDNSVRIGDYISLKFPKHRACLSAEGILVEDVYVTPSTSFFEEHLFQIYVQRQYSATNELEEFSEANKGDRNSMDAATASYYDALHRGKDNESVLNKSVMKSKTGNVVCFGDTIQLLHVKSNKFITVRPADLARDERENMKVTLSYDGNVMSWIKIMPRFKINREGEPVSNNAEILLKISERSNEFLHCADRPPPRGKPREVNSSMELPTGWKISVFNGSSDLGNTNFLLGGQLISIRDPEFQCMLAPLSIPMNLDSDTDSQTVYSSLQPGGGESNAFETPWISQSKIVDTDSDSASSDEEDDASISSTDEFLQDNGEVNMRPISEDDVDSDALWVIESKVITRGGLIKYKNDKMFLRHFNTGKYLGMRLKEEKADDYILTLEKDADEKLCCFYLQELHGTTESLGNGKAIQLRHCYHGVYLQRGSYHDGQSVYSCMSTRSRSKALSVIVLRYQQKKESLPSNPSQRYTEETLDVYFANAVIYHMQKYVKATVLPSGTMLSDVASWWPRIDPVDKALFPTLISRTTWFVRGYPIRVTQITEEDEWRLKGSKTLVYRRQNILREMGLLEAVMLMIKNLQGLSNMISSEASTAKMVKGGFLESGRNVLSQCLNLLFDLIKENTTSQLYIADHLLTILSHVSSDKTAAEIAQELLTSNRELQETKIGNKEITIFAEKMRVVHMNPMYLHLLRTCCSCLGVGIPRNQEIVHRVLFHHTQDVLINIIIDAKYSVPMEWNGPNASKIFDLYVGNKANLVHVRGESLFSNGIPLLKLTWNIKSHRFTPMKLFGRQEPSVGDVMGFTRVMIRAKNTIGANSKQQIEDAKQAVGDFFAAQLQLCGELCLGRNYPIINEMEKRFSYEFLISILYAIDSPALKSTSAYLLHNLYIDQKPQTEVHLPRLTRTLSEISSKEKWEELVTVSFPTVGHKFALIQVIVANHLVDIKNKKFPQDTINLLLLLHSLIKFSYYGSISKLEDCIVLLMDCLKRGDFDIQADPDDISFKRIGTGGTMKKGLSRTNIKMNTSIKNLNARNVDEQSEVDFSEHGVTFREFSKLLLGSLESFTAHMFMIIFVILTMGASIYEFLEDHYGSLYFEIYEFGIFVLLMTEFVLHFILHMIVRQNFLNFFTLKNGLDFITIALYATYFIQTFYIYLFVKGFQVLSRGYAAYLYYIEQEEAAKALEAMNAENISNWIAPARHSTTNDYTIQTMVKIVQILISIQSNVEDRKLSILLKKFIAWRNDIKQKKEHIRSIFTAAIEESSNLVVIDDHHDDTLIDLIMYSSPILVQYTLDLLMMHHTSSAIFLENINKMQFITSEEGEAQFSKLSAIVASLKLSAETHEVWGKLDGSDFVTINKDMHDHLIQLTNDCRKLREVLRFNESWEAVKFTQNILRNLGFFDIAMQIVHLILPIDRDGVLHDYDQNTRNLALSCNRLLYWFIVDNPANQSLAYAQLPFFIKTIDSKIESHRVISVMFRDNIELMELVPKKHIAEFVDMICNTGRFPQYLSLMASIINVGEKNVIRNQYEVIKLMSSPENVKKVSLYFVPINHPEYTKKIRLMSSHLNQVDVRVEDLPSDLAYHLELMGLLSCCTIGRSGMTSIEAKVQSLFNFVDVVEAMLDGNCLLLAKIKLGQFLYNAALDVETPIPALKDAACIWKLLVAAEEVFTFAKDELRQIEKNGWSASTSNRQRVEYMIVCAMVVESYFRAYYEPSIFKSDFGQVAAGVERIAIKEVRANEIIRSLFSKISAIYDMVSPLLSEEHHEALHSALVALNNSAKERIVADVENKHKSYFESAKDYLTTADELPGKSFDDFMDALNKDEDLSKEISSQIQIFIAKIEQLPRKSAAGNAEVCFEAFIQKLVSHIRGCVTITIQGEDTVKNMDGRATKTSIWILKMLRTMIENRWGMSIYERDDDGGEEQDEAVVDLMAVYNTSGVTEMCLDLISRGIEVALQSEALKLLVGMLFKEGGALEIQKTIHTHLSHSGSDMFFMTVRQILHNLMSWHKWNGVVTLKEGEDPSLPDEIIIVRCLQLMCEGHYGANQDLFREQPNNFSSVNLLDDFVLYLQCLDPIKCRTSTGAELSVLALVLEVIQGPCEGNQDYLALNTELIETLNRKIRQQPVNDCDEGEEMELKKSCIDIFQALLEGQGRKTAVYERMLSVIHVDVILVLCQGQLSLESGERDGEDGDKNTSGKGGEIEESDESVELRTESLVLMQMLIDFRPTLKDELGLGNEFDKLGNDSIACIEVVWRGELQRRFFHIPDICLALAKSTKDNFILHVKRASPEDKLYGLLEATKDMYREVLHQQLLKSYKVDAIFSRTNHDRTTWANFYIVLCINLLFVFFYTTEHVDCESAGLYDSTLTYIYQYQNQTTSQYYQIGSACTSVLLNEPYVDLVILGLNVILIAGAIFSLVNSLVVRAPVNFQSYQEAGNGTLKSILYTALNFSTLYYSFYLVIAMAGLLYHPMLSFLLLDFITMSPTSQGVLRAVSDPWKQILMTLVLLFIIIYIFAMFEFFFFANADNFTMSFTYNNLCSFVRYLLRWGMPYFSPENQMQFTLITYRVYSDICFYISTLIMMNILKGITIDTFVSLRKQLEARVADTTEKCFICGIEKNTFNRTLDRDAFRQHIKHDQSLWNYIYFIIYVWEQDKDDDDGLESFVRKCIENNDLIWFPMNKAIRLAEHQAKGDVNSLKYKFRKDMENSEKSVMDHMNGFKDQVNRTIARVEKALEYELEADNRRSRAQSSRNHSRGNTSGELLDDYSHSASNIDLKLNLHNISTPLITPVKLTTTALDADILGQMHLRVISILGMTLPVQCLPYVVVRIISDFHTTIITPISNLPPSTITSPFNTEREGFLSNLGGSKLLHDNSNLKSTKATPIKETSSSSSNTIGEVAATTNNGAAMYDAQEEVEMKFDLVESPAALIHQGPLPKSDLSKVVVKIQVLYKVLHKDRGAAAILPNLQSEEVDEGSLDTKLYRYVYLAGAQVPLVKILSKAHEGKLLEVEFEQRAVEITVPLAHSSSQSSLVGEEDSTMKGKRKSKKKNPTSSKFHSDESQHGKDNHLQYVGDDITLVLPGEKTCKMSLSCVASHKLLQDWNLLMHHR